VNERPILFSGPMVRAILDGRKTQTRRVVKPCRQFTDWDCMPSDAYGVEPHIEPGKFGFLVAGDMGYTDPVVCPYGQPGDRLWVRETWRPMSFGWNQTCGDCVRVEFAADHANMVRAATEAQYDATHPDRSGSWRPSIHMPRWASRITLEITGVRVERLQDITAIDVDSEGALTQLTEINDVLPLWIALWDSINAKRGYGWSVNPWVWVIEFKRVGQAPGEGVTP